MLIRCRMEPGKHTYHTTIYTYPSFYSETFSLSKMCSPLLFPAFSSIPKYPLSLVQSWAMFSMLPMMHGRNSWSPPKAENPLVWKVLGGAAVSGSWWRGWSAPCSHTATEAVLWQPQTGFLLLVCILDLSQIGLNGLMAPVVGLGAAWQGIILASSLPFVLWTPL